MKTLSGRARLDETSWHPGAKLKTMGFVSALLASASLLPASGVWAADADAAAEAANESYGIANIVVTAQRRSQNLQDVPISVTAVTAEQLFEGGVTNTQALQMTVPGLTFNRTGNEGNVYIRGVGTNLVGTNVEQAVAIYVDGVYYASSHASVLGFNNIERIEVLKGPQGTLFGRNTTGGVIQIITQDPSEDPSAKFELGYGNYDTVKASAYATVGLAEGVAIDIAATYEDQGKGFGTNFYNDEEINKQSDDNIAVRSKLLVRPSENTKITLGADYSYMWDNNTYRVSDIAVGPDGTTSPGRFNATANYPEYVKTETGGGTLNVEQQLGELTLTSITGLRRLESVWQLNQDGVPASLTEDIFYGKLKTFSQEVQLSGSSDRFDWVAGAFYYDAKAGYDEIVVDLAGSLIEIRDYQYTKSWAGFAQGTYEIFDGTKLTGGIRYTKEKQRFDVEYFAVGGGAVPLPEQRQSYGKVTWRVALDQQLTEDVLAYISYNRGFKSGGYNALAPTDPAYKAETIDAFELGLKSTLFNNRLRLNGAGFWYEYKNIQAQVPIPGGTRILNGPKARIKGVEVDFEAMLAPNLTLTGGATYIDGTYVSYPGAPFVDSNGNVAPPPTDATGNHTLSTPKFMANIALNYNFDTEYGNFAPSVSLAYNDGFYYYPDNRIRQPDYTVLNASIRWTLPNERFNIRIWGHNLTNAKYFIGRSQQVGNVDIDRDAPPRTYGITFGAEF